MVSIHKDLSIYILTSSILLITVVGYVTDYSISNMLKHEFDQSLRQKAGVLMTLASQKRGIVDFNFADELMPEYERQSNPEYFKLYFYNNKLIEKSRSLNKESLPHYIPKSDVVLFNDVTLASGRQIRVLTMAFTPRVEGEDYSQNVEGESKSTKKRLYNENDKLNIILSIGKGTEDLNHVINFIHTSMVIAAVLIIIFTLIVVRFSIKRGLKPLNEISSQIEQLDATTLKHNFNITRNVEELAPIIDQLNRLLKRIERSFKREKQFSSDVSHELRTPLAELRSIADVGKLVTDDKEVLVQFFDDLGAISYQMEAIVTNLMMLARCENSNETLDIEMVKLEPMLNKLINQALKGKKLKTQKISLVGDTHITIMTDEIKLRLILTNLISNAVSYGDASSDIEIIVRFNGNSADITVKNSARCLNHDDIDHMFDRFWRKDKARTDMHHAGLGLSLVKALSNLLNIKVHTQLDHQKVLTITLSSIATT